MKNIPTKKIGGISDLHTVILHFIHMPTYYFIIGMAAFWEWQSTNMRLCGLCARVMPTISKFDFSI